MMLRHRKVLLAVSLLVAGGSFYSALGYAVYLHSDRYRTKKERELARFLELPVSIGDVKPQNYYRADFLDIRAWLPGKRSEIFRCDVAEMHELPRQGDAFGLVIRNGRLVIDDDQWNVNDYRYVLRSGLAHDFAALQLRWVDLYDMDLSWRKGPAAFTVRKATGHIGFTEPAMDTGEIEGRISVISHTLNDTRTNEPINVVARFRPSRNLAVYEVVLRVPSMPVKALGLESLLGVEQTHGQFEGRLIYREENGHPHVSLDGRAVGIELLDWTKSLEAGPIRGRFDLQIDQAELTDMGLVSAKFSGRAQALNLTDLARVFGLAPLEGAAAFEVLSAEIGDAGVVRMSVRGEVVDGSLEPIVAMIGPGKLTGTFRLKVNSLDVADNQVVSADVDFEVVPPKDKPGTLDTELIIHGARKLMGVELSPLISATLRRLDSVTYSRLAFKLIADEGQLRILGTHGAGRRAILTVKVFGTDLAVVTQPERPMELAPLMTQLRTTGQERLRELFQRYQPTTTSVPAMP
ncbi:MAG: hypothetical protein JXQ73_01235 [Phycisphaerae bacterium]|nr:hypothetical protein [Phycisphaerae bacterium]